MRRFPFDEVKLRTLIEKAEQAAASRRDLSERLQSARRERSATRSEVLRQENESGEALASTLRKLEAAEALAADLERAKDVLVQQTAAGLETSRNCEAFARSFGWTPDGSAVAKRLTPGIGQTKAERGPQFGGFPQ
ncbi:MAG: hypothetical protein C1943_03855 [Halochromatium sp.]|nr:hypothetical protein [Halochromatium sp.]